MDELNFWGGQQASPTARTQTAQRLVDAVFASARPGLVAAIETFLAAPITPIGFLAFEMALLTLLRQLGRGLLEAVVQTLEPQEAALLPENLLFQCDGYRRRTDRTRNAGIATRFGTITLMRTGYRSWQCGEETIFPLELLLGLTQNVTPALTDLIGRSLAAAGMSQQAVLAVLKEQCGVQMGVGRLRNCLAELADEVEPLRQACQVDQLIEMLNTAQASSGSRKPVLSVGRDGITLRQYQHSFFEVATAATVSVYNRVGKRLGTVYMAYPPELGQATMDRMLSDLLQELLTRWEGPLPRLAYVTDSGSNEVGYCRRVLKPMKHPTSGERLKWTRVADFYHVSERVWAMADALFTEKQERQADAWARRMLKDLKRPSGVSRVLHSAASLYHRRTLGQSRTEDFWKAYRYLQSRTQYLKYHDYQSNHLPIGSGVTEAACKTIFTQRLKLSGMRWSHEGARRVLTLRTILLSGTWGQSFAAYLTQHKKVKLRAYEEKQTESLRKAA